MNLPIIKDDNQTLQLIQSKWASILNPLLQKLIPQANILKDVNLVIGENVINHLLARKQQGWFIVNINASANIYSSAPFNDKTLTLTSDAICTVSLAVF